ncbi:MAG TPA: MMPL family transporter [Thermoleophilaceae bacterium]
MAPVGRLTALALRRPRRTLALFGLVVAVLSGQAAQLERRLDPPDLAVPGTGSARATELAGSSFGSQMTIPVLLRGSPRALDRQGPRLARALRRDPRVTVLSPWDRVRSSIDLRPSPRAGMVVALVRRPARDSLDVASDVRKTVRKRIRAPVRAHVTGQAPINLAVRDANFEAARKAEMIALPLLAIVLLLVFRSPVAAAVPALWGTATVIAGFGVLSLMALVTSVQPLAVSLASMIGLALGVDYSLLVLSRFRQELEERGGGGGPGAHDEVLAAARAATATAGRTVIFAGVALIAAIGVTVVAIPGQFLLSATIGVLVVAALSLAAAVLVMPAALVVLGHNVNRWMIWPRRSAGGFFARASARATGRPALAAAAMLALMLALAAPALSIDPVPPGVSELPRDDRATRDYRTVSRVMGAGWGAPFELLGTAPSGTVAERGRLAAFRRLQARLKRDPDVADVVGPGDLAPRTAAVARLPEQLDGLADALRRGRDDLGRFERGLGRAQTGVIALRSGLAAAAEGSARLSEGGAAGSEGARQLRAGTLAAARGAAAVQAGIEEAAAGAGELATGAGGARAGSARLASELRRVAERVGAAAPASRELAAALRDGSRDLGRLQEPAGTADEQVAIAFAELRDMTVGKADPGYERAFRAVATARGALTGRDPITNLPLDPGYDGIVAALRDSERAAASAADAVDRSAGEAAGLARGLSRLAGGADDLAAGIARLEAGNAELAAGIARLGGGGAGGAGTGGGAAALTGGLLRLDAGAAELAAGVGRLGDGGSRLARELGDGHSRSAELPTGLARLREGTARFSGELDGAAAPPGDLAASPGFLRSGYLTLAALAGAEPARRELARLAVNVEGGGDTGRVLIVPRTAPQSDATERLGERLRGEAARFGRETGLRTELGGEAAVLGDFGREASGRLPLIMLLLAAITVIVLVPIFRSVALPVVAVVLNLLTVGAAFGVLVLLFQGSDPIAGGPGDVFVIPVLGIFTIVYGLSIDYEVFIIARMREGWLRTGSADAAIDHGVRHTAGVVTGAAAIMTGVFLAFAATEFHAVRQLGVGLATAVILDATVVRLLLLPAIMRVLGERAWWVPDWLDRRLPAFDLEGPSMSVGASSRKPKPSRTAA